MPPEKSWILDGLDPGLCKTIIIPQHSGSEWEKKQVVHVNRVRPLLEEDTDISYSSTWNPPLFQDNSHDEPSQQSSVDRPRDPRNKSDFQLPMSLSGRIIRPMDYYGY